MRAASKIYTHTLWQSEWLTWLTWLHALIPSAECHREGCMRQITIFYASNVLGVENAKKSTSFWKKYIFQALIKNWNVYLVCGERNFNLAGDEIQVRQPPTFDCEVGQGLRGREQVGFQCVLSPAAWETPEWEGALCSACDTRHSLKSSYNFDISRSTWPKLAAAKIFIGSQPPSSSAPCSLSGLHVWRGSAAVKWGENSSTMLHNLRGKFQNHTNAEFPWPFLEFGFRLLSAVRGVCSLVCGSDTFWSIKIFDCARHKLAVKYTKKLFAGCQTQLPGCQFIVRGGSGAQHSIQIPSS